MLAVAASRSSHRPRSRARLLGRGRGRCYGAQNTQNLRCHAAISGRRYYNPSQGRFVGRDPIEEQGGINLYGYCGNNGVNRWDYLGMNGPPTISFGADYVAPDPGPLVGPVAQQQTTLTIVGPALGGGPSAGLVGPVTQQFRAWDSNDPTNLTGSEYWSQDDWRPFLAWQNEQSLSTAFENPGFPLAGSSGFDRLLALDLWTQQMVNMALWLAVIPEKTGLDANLVANALANGPRLANNGNTPVQGSTGGARVTITGGTATYYNPTGNLAADGSVYDGTGMTAATNVLITGLGVAVSVTGTYNGVTRTISVTVTDRMPFGSLQKGAVIDLSPTAFNALFGPGTATPGGPGRVPVIISYPSSNGDMTIHLPDWLVPVQLADPAKPGTGKGSG